MTVHHNLVCIIENDPTCRLLLTNAIKDAGYDCHPFCDIESFVASGLESSMDVLVSTVTTTGGNQDGLDNIERLRASGNNAQVVALAPGEDYQLKLRAARLNVYHYFTKPVDIKRIKMTLDDITGRSTKHPYKVCIVSENKDTVAQFSELFKAEHFDIDVTAVVNQSVLHSIFHGTDVFLIDHEVDNAKGHEIATLIRFDKQFANSAILLLENGAIKDYQPVSGLRKQDYSLSIDALHIVNIVKSRAKESRKNKILAKKDTVSIRLLLNSLRIVNEHAIISRTDASGRITFVNQKFIDITGYAESEIIGSNHRLIKSGVHEPSFYDEMWSTISSGEIWKGVICNRRKNGELYWVESTIAPLMDAHNIPYEYISVRTDVTELVESKQRMNDSMLFTEAVINAIPGVFYVLDINGHVIKTNKNTEDISGYTQKEIKTMNVLEFFPEAEHPSMIQAIQQVFEAGSVQIESEYLTKDNRRIPFFFQGVKDTISNPPIIIGTGVDITHTKQTEKSLIEAKELAEKSNNAKSAFLASMSHELRTPMNAVLGFSQLIEMDEALDTRHQESIKEVLKAGYHLLSLINDVLDLSRIESNSIALKLERVACGDMIESAVGLTLPLAMQANVSLTYETKASDEVVYMEADPTRIKQVLINLIANAIKYNNRGGEVIITTEAILGFIQIKVKDTGNGIPEEYQSQVFEPFNRLGQECGTIEGTGIGLALVKRLVDAMGGSVSFKSAIGEGSEFYVKFPVIECTNNTKNIGPTLANTIIPHGAHYSTILYIEDITSNIELMERIILMNKQYKLIVAHDGQSGIASALKNKPDLILLDINLPDMDGYAVFDQLRHSDITKHIPIFAVTANAMDADIKKGQDSGFDDYITKPLNVGYLIGKLAATLKR